MGSPASLREVALLVMLWRDGRRLGSAGLGHHRLRRRLLRLQLLQRLVLGRLVRLKMMKRLINGRIDGMVEARRRRLGTEVLRLAG